MNETKVMERNKLNAMTLSDETKSAVAPEGWRLISIGDIGLVSGDSCRFVCEDGVRRARGKITNLRVNGTEQEAKIGNYWYPCKDMTISDEDPKNFHHRK